MPNLKTEYWNGHAIRFVEKDGEWWAVLKDVCDVLGLNAKHVGARLRSDGSNDKVVSNDLVPDSIGKPHKTLIVNEFGIYDTVFQSRKPEARDFRFWVYGLLKTLRQASGLQGFEVFRTLDKEHQLKQMAKLRDALEHPVRVDFIKANTITNRTVSTMHGSPKLLKKGDMNPQMLVEREKVLADTVDLMALNDRFKLGLSVSETIYNKWSPTR